MPDKAELAIDLAKLGRYKAALRSFEEGECYKTSPEAASYYSVCVAAVEGEYDRAQRLSVSAIKKSPFDPLLYANLGLVLVLAGKKDIAVRAFLKGLSIDPQNAHIINQMRRLGIRKSPVIESLPRNHPLNKILGILRSKLGADDTPEKTKKPPAGRRR